MSHANQRLLCNYSMSVHDIDCFEMCADRSLQCMCVFVCARVMVHEAHGSVKSFGS